MALEKRLIALPFAQGVDTKTDPKQVVGKLAILENATFDSLSQIQKRNGYRAIGADILNEMAPVSKGAMLAAYGNELVLGDGSSLFTHIDDTNSWRRQGNLTSVKVTDIPVCRNSYEQVAQDSAVITDGSLGCFVWEDGSGGVRYSIVDLSTGANVAGDTQLDALGSRPHVVVIGTLFVVTYVVGSELHYAAISAVAPLSVRYGLLAAGLSTSSSYDVLYHGGFLFVAHSSPSGAWLRVYDQNLSALDSGLFLGGTDDVQVVAIFSRDAATCLVAWSDVTTTIRSVAVDTHGPVGSTRTISVGAPVSTMTGAVPAAGTYEVYCTLPNADTTKYLINKISVIEGGAHSTSSFVNSVGLASKAFQYGGSTYLIAVHESPLQPTYFLLNSSGAILSRILPGVSGGLPHGGVLTQVTEITPGRFQVALGAREGLGGATFSRVGVSSIYVDFADPTSLYHTALLANTLHVGGGALWMYDGLPPVEQNFFLFPEGLTSSNVEADTGAAQKYQYVACYEWTDNYGQIHRSVPSVGLAHDKLTAIDVAHRVKVTVPTLRLTAKKAPLRGPVEIVLYRTKGGATIGTTLFRVSSLTVPTYNDTTLDSVDIVDALSDSVIDGMPQLYTTGGVLENEPPPPTTALAVWNNRVVAVDSSHPLRLIYSKIVKPGTPVEFNIAMEINVDPRGGAVTTIANLDDKLIIFKEELIFFMAGKGPDDLGNQNDFSDAILVTTDGGCVDPRSVVLVPEGLMYKSHKGIYMLSRDLNTSYIGFDVDAYNDATITSAQLMRDTNQVRFTLDSGIALVYDYLVKQWSVFTNIQAADATIYKGLFAYVRPSGAVRVETPNLFDDTDGNPITLRARTAWLSTAGLQGFARVYCVYVLGTYRSAHNLKLTVAYDYNSTPFQETIIDAGALLGNPVYGADVFFGSGTPFGGAFPLYQWRVDMRRQKCTAFQVTVEDQLDSGEGLSLSALGFEIGTKKGLVKLPPWRSFG